MSQRSFALLRTEAELHSIRPEWERLYLESAPRNPFLSPEWSAVCWDRCRAHAQPFLLTLREGSRLVGLAPLRRERHWGFRLLRFLGDGRSDYLGFLSLPGREEIQEALLGELAQRRNEWDLALLRHLAEPFSRLHLLPLPPGLHGSSGGSHVNSLVAHPGGWETLRATGPGWLGRMEKRLRKWERLGGSACRYVGAEAAAQVPRVAAIEERSWKGRAGTARFCSPAGQRTLRQALLELGTREEMELWLAFYQGEPIAYEINLLTPERIWLYQGAYEECHRKLGSGSILEFCSIRHAWEKGAREYDYLSGEEEYKEERTDSVREVCRLALYPNTPVGHLLGKLVVRGAWRFR